MITPDEYKLWRRTVLGASEAPIIMGVSPWMTRLQLWEQKTGRAPHDQTNWATQRGNDLEPRARAAYELEHDLEMPPTVVIHPEIDYLTASLDGFNGDSRIWLEIKCPGKESHAEALEGRIPDRYKWQMVQQGLVCNGLVGHYWSYDGFKGALVEFSRDPSLEEQLLKETEKFWKLVKSDTPPEPSAKDFKKIRDKESVELFARYRQSKAIADAAADAMDALAEQIKLKFPDARVACAGVQLLRYERKGSINYKSVPELKGVDLEQYRGKPIQVEQLKVVDSEDT